MGMSHSDFKWNTLVEILVRDFHKHPVMGLLLATTMQEKSGRTHEMAAVIAYLSGEPYEGNTAGLALEFFRAYTSMDPAEIVPMLAAMDDETILEMLRILHAQWPMGWRYEEPTMDQLGRYILDQLVPPLGWARQHRVVELALEQCRQEQNTDTPSVYQGRIILDPQNLRVYNHGFGPVEKEEDLVDMVANIIYTEGWPPEFVELPVALQVVHTLANSHYDARLTDD